MIVVAIIAVISAIAIPNLLESRKSANHTSAHKSLQTIHTAQEMYRRKYDSFADDYGDLYTDSRLIQRDLSDANTTTGGAAGATAKSGYYFESNDNFTDQQFMCVGGPANPGSSGDFLFFVNEEGTVYKADADADEDADTNIDAYTDGDDDWDPDSWTVAGN